MALKERVPLLDFAKANAISRAKAYKMIHAKKYKGIMQKMDGRWNVDVQAFEKMLEIG